MENVEILNHPAGSVKSTEIDLSEIPDMESAEVRNSAGNVTRTETDLSEALRHATR